MLASAAGHMRWALLSVGSRIEIAFNLIRPRLRSRQESRLLLKPVHPEK